jgi:aminoglycoside phosphotransferase (APT) family kinase protein
VVKVAPAGLMPTKNRDVLRQARLLDAIHGAPGVRVPGVLFRDTGSPPEVPPFFAMTFVSGECFEPILDETETLPAPQEIRARELHAAAMLASLHAVDPVAAGLADEPAGTIEDEVDRWVRVLETVDEELRPRAPECARALTDAIPEPSPPVVLHGDFRLGNTLARDGEVQAIIDWEIWSIGDPRIDVGWYLMSTHSSKQPTAIRDAPGMPTDDELMATYEATYGRVLRDMDWFHALSRFKAAAITSQIMKHNRRRDVPDPIVAKWAPDVPAQFINSALNLLG